MLYENSTTTANYDTDEDVKRAADAGIDAFAANTFSENQATNVMNRVISASIKDGRGFKVFLSADMSITSSGNQFTAQEVVNTIKKFKDNELYLKIDGKPVLSTFKAQEAGAGDWWKQNVIDPLKADGIDILFIPQYYGFNQNQVKATYDVWETNYREVENAVDGLFMFGSPKGVPFDESDIYNIGTAAWSSTAADEALARVMHDNGKITMATYKPTKNVPCRYTRPYYEFQGGKGTENQWRSIIEKQKAEMVQIVTWNDWTEGTHVQPTLTPKQYNDALKTYPHTGYYELMKHYIKWYKTGIEPSINKDGLFYFYKTQPVGATASNDALHCNVPWVGARQMFGRIADELHVTTMLTAPAELVVYTGTQKKIYNVGAGIVHTDIPFNIGEQKFELRRNGILLTKAQGPNINANPEAYNFNQATGFSYAN